MKIKFTRVLFSKKKALLMIIMKSFIFLFCFTAFGFTPKSAFSQNSKIKIVTDRTVSVVEVFELIKKQTDYTFIYRSDLFDNASPVELKKGVTTVKKLLQKSLSRANLTFEFTEEGSIVLKKGGHNLIDVYQQNMTGKITDKDNIPLSGVNVILNEGQGGTVTDFDGNYKIAANKGDKITFSYIGYTTQKIIVANQTIINITLTEDINKLDEIVLVTTGYQTVAKERVTGSFEKIDQKKLEIKTSQNIISKIEGEVSGIVFDAVDGPTIRGLSTINANNDPLVVVDGFPINQGLETINPNDVESITVLKDAAAASIWGTRAANGVIVIVTKKGKKGNKTAIEFSSNFSITPKNNLRDLPYASTESFLEFEKHRADTDWVIMPTGNNQPALGKGLETYLLLNDGQINQTEADAIINSLKNIDSRDEFQDLFMRDEAWTQYNLAASGGGESNTYRASLTYNRNENLNSFTNSDQDEIIANITNSIKLSPKLSFNSIINYRSLNRKLNGLTNMDYERLYQDQQILDSQGNYVSQPNTYYQPYLDSFVANGDGAYYDWGYNLKQEWDNKNNKTATTDLRLQTALKYALTDYLSIEGRYQYEWSQLNTFNLYNESTYRVRNTVNRYTSPSTYLNSIPKGHILGKAFSTQKAHTARVQFNLDKSFNDGMHQLNAVGGYEVKQVLSDYTSLTRYGYDPASLTFANIAYGERVATSPRFSSILNDLTSFFEEENRFISYYTNVGYTFDDKYSISGSTRLDDSNLFGASEEYRNIPLYSFGAKWNITKEAFFNSNIINKLSLRTTYGSNGNVDRTTSPYLQASNSRSPYTNIPFLYISNVKNPELRYESTFVTNLGLDIGLFNNRIDLSIEYYEKKSKDLLAPVSVSSTYGFNSALINIGEMENKGFDIGLRALVINDKNFKYNTTLNFSYNKNEVTNVEVPEVTVPTYLNGEPLQGKPLRYLYSYNYAGLDTNGDPQTYNENDELVNVEGEVTDINGNLVDSPISDVEALVYHGTTTPKYYGAWINNFSYKGFSIRALTTFKLGHVFRNNSFLKYRELGFTSTRLAHIHKDFENRWQNPGDENLTDIPRAPIGDDVYSAGYAYYQFGKQSVDNASHIRIRELILGYDFNADITKRLGINSLNLSIQATNIAVFTFNKWNVDPENITLPSRPSFTLNLRTNF